MATMTEQQPLKYNTWLIVFDKCQSFVMCAVWLFHNSLLTYFSIIVFGAYLTFAIEVDTPVSVFCIYREIKGMSKFWYSFCLWVVDGWFT